MTPDQPWPAAASRDEYTLTVDEAAILYERAGHPRIIRTLQRYCANGHLDCIRQETQLAIRFHPSRQRPQMTKNLHRGITLYGPAGRKYLTGAERQKFIRAAATVLRKERLLFLVLAWSGSRLSEALALTPAAIDLSTGTVSIETLKRRRRGIIRQVPLPRALLTELDCTFGLRKLQHDPEFAAQRLWRWSRATAWRKVKASMHAAGLFGPAATPKGLRHAFGVSAFQSNIPPHIVQRWLGHASLRTTAIYGDVSGREERAFAARMWRH